MCDRSSLEHQHHSHEHHHHERDLVARPDGESGQFRVVFTGKGGVGKTSLVAILSRLLARQDYAVLALDADPQMNLPWALGLDDEAARALVPLSRNPDYVEEKTGARPGSGWGLLLRLHPDASDVVERFGVVGPDGVRLLVMGTTVQPAVGCLCPENTLLRSVVDALSLRQKEVILMDTQAGVEHFGRALAKGFHQSVVVSDPTFNGIQVAVHAARLARQMGIPAVHLVLNRVRNDDELERAMARLAAEEDFAFTSRHVLPWDERLLRVEPDVGAFLGDSAFLRAVVKLGNRLVRTEMALRHRECAETVS
jgi:CO dehydrogenase maturation factor